VWERRLDNLERRLARLRGDPPAEEIVREAFERAWAPHAPALELVLERFEATGKLDLSPEEERELDALWDALHEEARRLADARGVPWERVLARLAI